MAAAHLISFHQTWSLCLAALRRSAESLTASRRNAESLAASRRSAESLVASRRSAESKGRRILERGL